MHVENSAFQFSTGAVNKESKCAISDAFLMLWCYNVNVDLHPSSVDCLWAYFTVPDIADSYNVFLYDIVSFMANSQIISDFKIIFKASCKCATIAFLNCEFIASLQDIKTLAVFKIGKYTLCQYCNLESYQCNF